MEVAVAGVEHVADAETVLLGELLDLAQNLGRRVRGTTPSCT
jgi:hypothetical protein